MTATGRIAAVIVTYNRRELLREALDAVMAQTRRPDLVVVVDNASDDGTAELLAGHPARPEVLRLDRNTGYAGALAAALPLVKTRYVAWLNDDAVPSPEWLSLLENALDGDERAAAASARLVDPSGRTQSVGVALTPLGYGQDLASTVTSEVFGFCGGAALLRTSSLRAVGGVPADFFCYYEDTDTSWRLRLGGWRVVSVPHATVRHLHGASAAIGSPDFHRWNERNRLVMLLRCAPARVAVTELARFAAITALLPFRPAPRTPNFRPSLRLRVLSETLRMLPAALRARRALRSAGVTAATRRRVWRAWVGR